MSVNLARDVLPRDFVIALWSTKALAYIVWHSQFWCFTDKFDWQ
ncbi:hypothetical protein [Undibacterium sp. Tian12W]